MFVCSSVLSYFCVLGLDFLLDRHLLLAMNSHRNDSIIALSYRTYTGGPSNIHVVFSDKDLLMKLEHMIML